MNLLIPIVMGTTILAYVHSFNSTMLLYKKSNYTLSYQELLSLRYNEMIKFRMF
jgi:hypothetical protein